MGDILGFLSALCFGLCGLPQAIKCVREKSADGVSSGMIFLWVAGELFAIIYAIIDLGAPFWLMLNYITSILMLLPIMYFKFKKR